MTRPDPIVSALTARRKQLGYTQKHVAQQLHLAPPHLSMMERGKRRAGIEHVQAYAAILGYTLTLQEKP